MRVIQHHTRFEAVLFTLLEDRGLIDHDGDVARSLYDVMSERGNTYAVGFLKAQLGGFGEADEKLAREICSALDLNERETAVFAEAVIFGRGGS